MAAMNGVVEQVSTKDVVTKFGTKPTFSMKVSGGWVKCGFKNPHVNVGDEVSFDGESGTYGLEGKNIVITTKGTGAPPSVVTSSKAATPYSGSRVFPIPPLHGDRSIVRQNALARATEIVIGSAGGKMYEASTTTCDIIIHLARRFEAYTAGDLDLAEATKESNEEASSKKAAAS